MITLQVNEQEFQVMQQALNARVARQELKIRNRRRNLQRAEADGEAGLYKMRKGIVQKMRYKQELQALVDKLDIINPYMPM